MGTSTVTRNDKKEGVVHHLKINLNYLFPLKKGTSGKLWFQLPIPEAKFTLLCG